MDAEQLEKWILRRLGAPLTKVELTHCHIADNIEDARRWLSAKKGVRKQGILTINSGQVEYNLDSLNPEIDTVLDVAFPSHPFDLSLIFAPFTLIDDKVPYDVFAAPSSAGVYSTFTQTIQYTEMAKRVLSAEQDWRQEGRLLYLFPVPDYQSHAIIWFKSSKVVIEQLTERDHDLLKRYALALAYRDLGMVRSKYDSYPTAQGTVMLNGDRLLDMSNEMLEKLNEEIADSGMPMPFLVG
jgi:hypothetical protein